MPEKHESNPYKEISFKEKIKPVIDEIQKLSQKMGENISSPEALVETLDKIIRECTDLKIMARQELQRKNAITPTEEEVESLSVGKDKERIFKEKQEFLRDIEREYLQYLEEELGKISRPNLEEFQTAHQRILSRIKDYIVEKYSIMSQEYYIMDTTIGMTSKRADELGGARIDRAEAVPESIWHNPYFKIFMKKYPPEYAVLWLSPVIARKEDKKPYFSSKYITGQQTG